MKNNEENNCPRYDPVLTLRICCLFYNLLWHSKGGLLPSSARMSLLPGKTQSVSTEKFYFKFSKCCLKQRSPVVLDVFMHCTVLDQHYISEDEAIIFILTRILSRLLKHVFFSP